MPKRTDIQKILILGSGPIVIGQACEFDYSGTQGCKALKEEGYEIVLVNSNPATVMTDPDFSDRTYIEPLTPDSVAEIIRKERPQALLPTLGGQTALNLAMDLHRSGVLAEYGVEMIGAKPEAIEKAENREVFRELMDSIHLSMPRSGEAHSLEEALAIISHVQFPAIVRPSYTLGGTGGGVAYNMDEFREVAARGLNASPIHTIMVEESILGWKEYELEVIRDAADNAIIICGIENVDPVGIHTGDSITVAPIQTLSDTEYQAMRTDALEIIRAVGVDTGGCNIQFAVDPATGRRLVIEMNPRVSRSSALASKATGYPIARIAAKLAVGYRLDELANDITGNTSACFEPTVDYCVIKVPRFTFEKFPGADPTLGLQMKSVGETMSIGRTFREALQKALRGLEIGRIGFGGDRREALPLRSRERQAELRKRIRVPGAERIFTLRAALDAGLTPESIYEATGIDPWFINHFAELAQMETLLEQELPSLLTDALKHAGAQVSSTLVSLLRDAKCNGFSDRQLAAIATRHHRDKAFTEQDIRSLRLRADIRPCFKSVDTCAGEFRAVTPYFYSTYNGTADTGHLRDMRLPEQESAISGKPKIIILGGGPNRIGQGIEFDYCCVQAAFALKELGYEAIMVNSNPETVSTDYDTASKLYFEPLTAEDILAICDHEKPDGVIVQFGGQTPLNLARTLAEAGVPIIGTSPADIARAEDREMFSALLEKLNIPQPENGTACNDENACRIAAQIGYPVMVRPSFVLGGRAMQIVHDETQLRRYLQEALSVSADQQILVDRFLEDAIEMDVDAVVDKEHVTIAAIMEHIEQAGIHSGDSACSIPTHTLSEATLETIRDYTRKIGLALNTRGLLNIQFAVQKGKVYIIEANPRASRTVPFVSKATGVPVARIATKVMLGYSLPDLGFTEEPKVSHFAVKEAVLPFERFPGAVITLGPEMRSTGESMGIDNSFGLAYLKAQTGAGDVIPDKGGVLISVCDRDKDAIVEPSRRLAALGFKLYATSGTRALLEKHGIQAELAQKIGEGRPNLIDIMINGQIQIMINIVAGLDAARDALPIRATTLSRKIALVTTVAALNAAVEGLEAQCTQKPYVAALQDYY